MRKWQEVIHVSGDKGYIIDIEERSSGDPNFPDFVIEIQKADGTTRRDYSVYFKPE